MEEGGGREGGRRTRRTRRRGKMREKRGGKKEGRGGRGEGRRKKEEGRRLKGAEGRKRGKEGRKGNSSTSQHTFLGEEGGGGGGGGSLPNFSNRATTSTLEATLPSSRFQKWIQLRQDSQCLRTHPRGQRPQHSAPSQLLAPQYTSHSLLIPSRPPAEGGGG